MDSHSTHGHILAALTCPICLDLCRDPKILPCGHSLCADCLKQISFTTVNSNIVQICCPECRKTVQGSSKVQTNYIAKAATDIIRRENEIAEKAAVHTGPKFGESCPHMTYLSKSNTTLCDHCDGSFCSFCLIVHKELLKMEINFVSNNFRERYQNAQDGFAETTEKKRKEICENVKSVKQSIAAFGETMIEKLRTVVLEHCEALSKSTDELGEKMLQCLVEHAQWDECRQQEIESSVNTINAASSVYLPIGELSGLHKNIFELDRMISKMESVEKENSSTFTFSCDSSSPTSSFAEMLRNSAQLTLPAVSQDTKEDAPVMAHQYVAIHKAAEAGDFAGLLAITQHERLPPACRRFVVEHCDPTDSERTLLHQAAGQGCLDMVRYLVTDLQASVTARDKYDDMPIHVAAEAGQCDVIRYFSALNPGQLKEIGYLDMTPICTAAYNSEVNAVRFMIDELKQKIDDSLMEFACQAETAEVVSLLFDRGASPIMLGNKSKQNALHVAAHSVKLPVIKVVLRKHPELLQSVDCEGNTALHLSAGYAYNFSAAYKCVSTLLDRGANASTANKSGRSALHEAVMVGNESVIKLLTKRVPQVLLEKDLNGETPLQWATKLKRPDSILKLLTFTRY